MAPLRGLEGVMRRMADGDVGCELPATARRDEVGAMARAVDVFRDGIVRARAREDEAARAEVEAETRRPSDLEAMVDNFETAVGGIVAGVTAAATELRSTSQGMAGTATETASQATTVAAAEQAASNVATVAAAEELGASVEEIGRQVSAAAAAAHVAASHAHETVGLVQALSDAARRIVPLPRHGSRGLTKTSLSGRPG